MAKIDCSVTVNFLKEWRRMCLAEHAKCNDECPFSIYKNGEGLGCDVFAQKFPKTAVEIVQTWSDEHPVKTRLEDFIEKHPKAKRDENTGVPRIVPTYIGYCDKCPTCRLYREASYCCWHEPLDGGATGEAVE